MKTCYSCGKTKPAKRFYAHPMKLMPDGEIMGKAGGPLCYDCGREHRKLRPIQQLDRRYEGLPETVKAYLAGLIDADGHVTLTQRTSGPGYYDCRVTITNTDGRLMHWLEQVLGAGVFYTSRTAYQPHHEHDPSRDVNRWKTRHVAIFTNRKARGILHAVISYMVIKADRAQLVLDYYNHLVIPSGSRLPPELKEKRIAHFQKMRALNKRGR